MEMYIQPCEKIDSIVYVQQYNYVDSERIMVDRRKHMIVVLKHTFRVEVNGQVQGSMGQDEST